MRGVIVVAFLVMALLPAASQALQLEPGRPTWLRPCTVPAAGAATLCGAYEVWEDREARSGRRIALNVVVVPASMEPRLPDPVFYLAGGPGSGATGGMGFVLTLLTAVRAARDIVFLDLRGTGGSAPLACDEPGATAESYFAEFMPASFVRACRARQNADVGLYTNPIAMDDLEEVRKALGYGKINLFGVSGGTRSAQVFIRRHPQSVRSVVMKGVQPMDMENPLPHARSLERSIGALIDSCSADPDCRRSYPDLAGDWERVQQRFDDGPVAATVRMPGRAQTERVRLSRGAFADGLRQMLYSVERSRGVPRLLQAASRGDFDAFAQRELEQRIAYARLIAYGAFLTVTCAEDLRFVDDADIRRATDGTFMGDYRARRQKAACEIWGPGKGVADDFQQPVRSDLPVLLISGEIDAVTPPANGEQVARTLARARHIVFPNQSHDSPNPACEGALISSFITTADAAALDARCVAMTRRPPFLPPG